MTEKNVNYISLPMSGKYSQSVQMLLVVTPLMLFDIHLHSGVPTVPTVVTIAMLLVIAS